MTLSPNGRYGFHVTTCNGWVPQDNTWCDSWTEFFIRGLKRMFQLDEKAHGLWSEIEPLLPLLYETVVPRLLDPFE